MFCRKMISISINRRSSSHSPAACHDDSGVVKYAVAMPATPPTVPARVKKLGFDMQSGLIFGTVVATSRRCTRCTGTVARDRRVERARRRAALYWDIVADVWRADRVLLRMGMLWMDG